MEKSTFFHDNNANYSKADHGREKISEDAKYITVNDFVFDISMSS